MNEDRYINPKKIDLKLGALESDGELLIPLSAVRAAIAAAPSEDVVKVVRCKDCKYSHRTFDTFGNLEYGCYKMNLHKYVSPVEFCSHGERKNDEQAD